MIRQYLADLLATDKSRYFAQPCPIIANCSYFWRNIGPVGYNLRPRAVHAISCIWPRGCMKENFKRSKIKVVKYWFITDIKLRLPMTWTSYCFNVNVFVSSSYLLIHLLSFPENPSFNGSFSRKSWLKPNLFHLLFVRFRNTCQVLQKNVNGEDNGDWMTIWLERHSEIKTNIAPLVSFFRNNDRSV